MIDLKNRYLALSFQNPLASVNSGTVNVSRPTGPQSQPEKRVQAKSLMYGEKGKHYPCRKDEARSANPGTQKRTEAHQTIITGNHHWPEGTNPSTSAFLFLLHVGRTLCRSI
ncbi:MAG: hypothetical protein HN524_11235 [Verrucomicrobia bacterium]|nr:hypothetical protein [Verrucomicrobiota bacterium]MBT7911241.1 hypothetical protein [Verrucomicrobiota bacterium]